MILSEKTVSKKHCRIVSLVPSQTELLAYFGLEKEVVGITKFCVHPQSWFRNKPRVGGTKSIHVETLRRLSPDLIIANKEENVKDQVEELAADFDIWVTDVNNLRDALQMIQDVGKLTDRTEAASVLTLQIKEGFDQLSKFAKPKRLIRTAYFIWKDPYMVAGGDTFINDMMRHCGLENIFENQVRYPSITLNEIEKRNVELILLSSEPYPFKEKHRQEIQTHFPKIKIEIVDGEMFSWYGSRLLNSIEYFQSFLKRI